MNTTGVKDLKKGITYYLTYDFWGFGGTPVKLRRLYPARVFFPGRRGIAAEVVDAEGAIFLLGPGAWLFDDQPENLPK